MTEVKEETSTPAMFNNQQSQPAELIDKLSQRAMVMDFRAPSI
jgi:hypothetical protein